jgi:hypothetical protein
MRAVFHDFVEAQHVPGSSHLCHATRNVEGETPQQKLGGNKSLISATRQIPQAPDPSPPLVMEMQLASG